jgi:hypothetical protein
MLLPTIIKRWAVDENEFNVCSKDVFFLVALLCLSSRLIVGIDRCTVIHEGDIYFGPDFISSPALVK